MRRGLSGLAAIVLAGAALAQQASESPGGKLRVLDKLTGQSTDLDLSNGQSQTLGHLTIGLSDCRYPTDNPASDSWAHVTITDASQTKPVFSGWMLASSPALSALDHPRFDVWVLGCELPEGAVPTLEDDPAATQEPEG